MLVVALALLASVVSAYPLPHPLAPQVPWTLGEEAPALVYASAPEQWVDGWPRSRVTLLALGAPLPAMADEVDVVARPASAMPLRPAGYDLRMALSEGDSRLERWRKSTASKVAEGGSTAVSTHLADYLAEARISVIGPAGDEQRCAPVIFGRANCGKQPWEYVGVEKLKVAGRTESCIWAHPIAESILRISFPLPAAPGLLTGRAGFADSAVGPGREGEVSLRVTVAGEPVLELKRQRVQGFATLRGELPERSSAGRILFDIEGGTAAAHFCFDGDLRPRSPLAKALKPPTVSTNPTTKPVTKAPAAKPGAAVATPPAKPAANSPAPPAKPSVRP
jgi:hypothetical protein